MMRFCKVIILLLVSVFSTVGLAVAQSNDDPSNVALRMLETVSNAYDNLGKLRAVTRYLKDLKVDDLRPTLELLHKSILKHSANNHSLSADGFAAEDIGSEQAVTGDVCPKHLLPGSEAAVDVELISHAVQNAGFLHLGVLTTGFCGIKYHYIIPFQKPTTELGPLIATLDHLTLNTSYVLIATPIPGHKITDTHEYIKNQGIVIISPSMRDCKTHKLSEAQCKRQNRFVNDYKGVGEAVARLEQVRHHFLPEHHDIDIQRILEDTSNWPKDPQYEDCREDEVARNNALVGVINSHIERLQKVRDSYPLLSEFS